MVDDPFRGDVAPQSVFGEFCGPPVRTGPDQMPVLGPSGLVARPLAPETAVADRSPLVQALFGGNAEHLVAPPHRRIQIHASVALDQRRQPRDIVGETQRAEVLEHVDTEHDIEPAVDLEIQQVAIEHRVAYVRIGEGEGVMADLATGDRDPGLREQAEHGAGETAQFEAAARAEPAHHGGDRLLVEVDDRRPDIEPVVIPMLPDQPLHVVDGGVAVRQIDARLLGGGRLIAVGHHRYEIRQPGGRNQFPQNPGREFG